MFCHGGTMTKKKTMSIRSDDLLQTQKCSGCNEKYCLMVMFFLYDKLLGRGTIVCAQCAKEVKKYARQQKIS